MTGEIRRNPAKSTELPFIAFLLDLRSDFVRLFVMEARAAVYQHALAVVSHRSLVADAAEGKSRRN